MQQDDVAYLAQMLRRRSGLALIHPNPRTLENRLAPVMRRFGLKDMHSLVDELRHGRETLARAVTEAMTTNESSFFRDIALFEFFRDVTDAFIDAEPGWDEATAHLVHSLRRRSGSLFHRDASRRSRTARRWMDGRYHRHRHQRRHDRARRTRTLQPIRGAARIVCSAASSSISRRKNRTGASANRCAGW